MPEVIHRETEFLIADIADALRRFRKQHGLTLAQLSKQTGLSMSYLSDIERGKTKPTLDTFSNIITSYGATATIKICDGEKVFSMFGFIETQIIYALEKRDYGKVLLHIAQLMGACCEDGN